MPDTTPYRIRAEWMLETIQIPALSSDHAQEDMERLIRATMANAYATLALRDAVAGSVIDRFRDQ